MQKDCRNNPCPRVFPQEEGRGVGIMIGRANSLFYFPLILAFSFVDKGLLRLVDLRDFISSASRNIIPCDRTDGTQLVEVAVRCVFFTLRLSSFMYLIRAATSPLARYMFGIGTLLYWE